MMLHRILRSPRRGAYISITAALTARLMENARLSLTAAGGPMHLRIGLCRKS